ncbi:hypothetical protein [Photobacterium nomapromontoriensis]|uniref:hypothetical protein n=1 Tax=Photobacterium nomapromontoriensis TaxID=2910237 RepID=UPI003D0F8507
MEHASRSLSQTLTYLKHCNSQLMANRAVVPNAVTIQRFNQIISIESIELEHANKQLSHIQKMLFRALCAVDAGNTETVHQSLLDAIELLNSNVDIASQRQKIRTEERMQQGVSEPALAG